MWRRSRRSFHIRATNGTAAARRRDVRTSGGLSQSTQAAREGGGEANVPAGWPVPPFPSLSTAPQETGSVPGGATMPRVEPTASIKVSEDVRSSELKTSALASRQDLLSCGC